MRYILFVMIFIGCRAFAQQDPLYNLYSFNQFMINPAYAGVYKNVSTNLIARQQWVGIEGAPLTSALTVHSSIMDRYGAGLLIVNDRIGVNNTLEAQAAFSFKLINERGRHGRVLAMGVQGGVINYMYDYSKLNLEYVDDTDLDFTHDRYTKPNFGAGIFYMTDVFYLSLSVPRILDVNIEEGMTTSTRYSRHYYAGGGYVINGNNRNPVKLKTSFLLRYVENAISLDLSANVLLADAVWAGATLRNLNALALLGQFQVSNVLRIGYSLELPANQLIRTSYGTHEISLLADVSLSRRQRRVFRYF